jgi:quinol monooxygenase YgiN
MFVRVVQSSIDPAKIDDALALKDDVIAATKRQSGFVSFQGAVSRATGAFITVSTWETEDAAKLPVQEVLGDILARLAALGLEVKSVEHYEVMWSV